MQADELRDASRERLLAEIGALQHQYDISNQHQLLGRVRELEMALLQSRDYSMGLSAVVGELHVDHAVAFHPAQNDHGRGGDHVEDEFLCGATLHTGAAGDEFRTDDHFDGMV